MKSIRFKTDSNVKTSGINPKLIKQNVTIEKKMTRTKTKFNNGNKDLKKLYRKNAEQENLENLVSEVNINLITDNVHFDYEGDEQSDNSIVTKLLIPEDEIKIRNILSSHYLFSHLDDNVISILMDNFIEFNLNKDETLFNEGDPSVFFFIISKGEFSIFENNIQMKLLKENECFGEVSLLHNSPRTFTVKANTESTLYMLEGDIYRSVMQEYSTEQMSEMLTFIDTIGILNCLDQIQKSNISRLIIKCEFNDGQIIINKGDDGDRMFIIKEGYVSCIGNNKELKRMGPREYFGENSLVFDTKRTLNIISVGNTICYIIPKSSLEEVLGPSFKNIILYSFFKFHILKNRFLMNLMNEINFDDLYKIFEVKRYKINDIVFSKDFNVNKKLVLIFQGGLIDVNF
jgi:CRP-like cAMP-binding protein